MEDPPFIGDWEQRKKLGAGGFGEVILWRNRKTQQFAAIKKCKITPASQSREEEAKLMERWQQEIAWMRQLEMDYIVRAIDVQPAEFIDALNRTSPAGLPVLVMEYCEGGDLRTKLCQVENANGLPEHEVRNVLTSLRHAVAYLHDNFQITHRDIKPENIVITERNGQKQYKLTDLGYAKNIDCNTAQASMVGTKDYLAPEILEDIKYTNSVDYWSVGVIAFEIICGTRPFVPHQPLFTWFQQIRNKLSKHIAITEDNDGQFVFHEHLFSQNQISSAFQELIEKWLVLALERNRRTRGNEMLKPDSDVAPDELHKGRKLKFYSELDSALNAKILTVYSLSSYEFYSFVVTEDMSLNDLVQDIEKRTNIALKDLVCILPCSHKLNKISSQTKPIELLIEGHRSSSPMLYIARYGHFVEKIPDPNISSTIKLVIERLNAKDTLKKHVIVEFIRHAVFLLRDEQRSYLTLVEGLKDYALMIENDMVYYENALESTNQSVHKCSGAVEFLEMTVSHGEKLVAEKAQLNDCVSFTDVCGKSCDHLKTQIVQLNEANKRVKIRFNSALRRIRECYNDEFFKDYIKDHFNVKQMEKICEKVSSDKLSGYIDAIYQLIISCISKRSELLGAAKLKKIQRSIYDIHEEFRLIKEILNRINTEVDSMTVKVRSSMCLVLEQLTEMFQKHDKSNDHVLNIPNMEVIMGSLNLDNATMESPDLSLSLSLAGDMISSSDTKSLLAEHRQLLSTMQDHMHDVEMSGAD